MTATSVPQPTRRRSRLILQLAALPATVGILVLGVWIAGGAISDDFRVSMALTAAWFALAAIACAATAWRVPVLRVPVGAGYLLTVAVVGTYLGLTTLRDRMVDERVVTGVPATAPDAPRTADAPEPGSEPAAVELARGGFRSHEHTTKGQAAIVRLADGRRFLTLTGFATSAGPDLRVRLVPGDTPDGGADGNVDLGALKGNRGNQQYAIPAYVRVGGRTVVIWCRAFSAAFGSARLG